MSARNSVLLLSVMAILMCTPACRTHETNIEPTSDECPRDPAKTKPGVCGCGTPDVFDVVANDFTCNITKNDFCPEDPNKVNPGVCGCGIPDVDVSPKNGIVDCIEALIEIDLCPEDPNKKFPGVCGCGFPDTDADENGRPDCLDNRCPFDATTGKKVPGECGCGMYDLVVTLPSEEVVHICPQAEVVICPDKEKNLPGVCGCGVNDTDNIDKNGNAKKDGIPDCLQTGMDYCPSDPLKILPGVCGCGTPDDIDPKTKMPTCFTDSQHQYVDLCPHSDLRFPGPCGCDDTDDDEDGTYNCLDKCPDDPEKTAPGVCGCGVSDTPERVSDPDADGVPSCLDVCPQNRWKSTDDGCGCDARKLSLHTADGQEQTLCAKIISDPEGILGIHHLWNGMDENDYADAPKAYFLAEDIDLGRVADFDSSAWTGIGTESHPFNAVFMGNGKTIKAERYEGNTRVRLTLGKADNAFNALFGYTENARIESLVLDLSFGGDENVAALVGHAKDTTISGIRVVNRSTSTYDPQCGISGAGAVGGAVAVMEGGSLENVEVSLKICARRDACLDNPCSPEVCAACAPEACAEGECPELCDVCNTERCEAYGECAQAPSGGIVASVSGATIRSAAFSGILVGQDTAAGIAGTASETRFVDVYDAGSVKGSGLVAGLVGSLQKSQIFNAFSIASVNCGDGPCAQLAASVADGSRIKNAFVAGTITEPPAAPENPEENASRAAVIVADFRGSESTLDSLYYWNNWTSAIPPIPLYPPEATATQTRLPDNGFTLVNKQGSIFTPVLIADYGQVMLRERLNASVSCFTDHTCKIDNVPCHEWTDMERRNVSIGGYIEFPWIEMPSL